MKASAVLTLIPSELTLAELRTLSEGGHAVELDDACWPRVEAAGRSTH
jgi:hypothetical protein